MGEEGGAEAVVDVDDGDAGGAGGEHGVEGGFAVAGGAVAGGGGDCDEGAGEEAAQDTGESSFHAGDGDDGGGFAEGIEMGEDAVDAGNPDVGDLDEGVAEKLEGEGGLVGDGEVGGAGGDDGEVAAGIGAFCGGKAEAEAAGGLVVARRGGVLVGEDFGCFFRVHAGGQGLAVGGVDAGEIVGDLLRRFVFAKDDFGGALAQFAVKVEGGVTEFLEGELGHFFNGGVRFEGASSDLFKELLEGVTIHGLFFFALIFESAAL